MESNSLASALYDPLHKRLEIEFRSGERYLFFQVPQTSYQQLLQADSKGSYFNLNIRNHFPYQHLSKTSAPIVLAAHHKTK